MAQPSGKAPSPFSREIAKNEEFLKRVKAANKNKKGEGSQLPVFAGMDTTEHEPRKLLSTTEARDVAYPTERLTRRTRRRLRSSRAPSRSPSPSGRSRSPIKTRSYENIKFGAKFTAKPLEDAERTAKEVAERSHGALKALGNIQSAIGAMGAGGYFSSSALWLASKLPGSFGDMAAELRQLAVDNNSAVLVDVREALQLLFSFTDDELVWLSGAISDFAVRISSNDIRVYEYPQSFRCANFNALREDYRKVHGGEASASNVGMDYTSAKVCEPKELLAKVMNILFSSAVPKIAEQALKGDTVALKENTAATGEDDLQDVRQGCFYKITLICLRESLESLVTEGDEVFWEVWPEYKEIWPFSDRDTPAAIGYLKRYFNLLIDKKFDDAKAHFEQMGSSLGGDMSMLGGLLKGLQKSEDSKMELDSELPRPPTAAK